MLSGARLRDRKSGARSFLRLADFRGAILSSYFSLEGLEIVVSAFILVLLRDRYTNGAEQFLVLLST
jgi:hypothetical protein